jgi:hypothetical protein
MRPPYPRRLRSLGPPASDPWSTASGYIWPSPARAARAARPRRRGTVPRLARYGHQEGNADADRQADQAQASQQPAAGLRIPFSRTAQLLLLAAGVTPDTSAVEVAGGQVLIRCGPWRARLDRQNIGA